MLYLSSGRAVFINTFCPITPFCPVSLYSKRCSDGNLSTFFVLNESRAQSMLYLVCTVSL